MRSIFYKITDGLGWIFCEIFFKLLDIFYPINDPPKIIGWFLNKIYRIGIWFYNINKEIN
jgi:hypothetical protein